MYQYKYLHFFIHFNFQHPQKKMVEAIARYIPDLQLPQLKQVHSPSFTFQIHSFICIFLGTTSFIISIN